MVWMFTNVNVYTGKRLHLCYKGKSWFLDTTGNLWKMKKRSRTTLFSLRAPDELAAAILRYQDLLRMENVSESLVYFLKIGVQEFERQKSRKVLRRGVLEKGRADFQDSDVDDENEFLKNQVQELKATLTTLTELVEVIITQNSCLFESGPYNSMLKIEKDSDVVDRYRDTLWKIKRQEVKEKRKYL